MGRPFYPAEADDADLDWLVSNFLYERPDYLPVEAGGLPLLLLPFKEETLTENFSEETEIDSLKEVAELITANSES